MSRKPSYTDYERGMRQALIEVNSFIAMHGKRQLNEFCAERLHCIWMDAAHRDEKGRLAPPRGER
jgi:hypothetical protein